MAPRVSVVVPSYNHERFVQQAIQSVLDQSFQDFEIVITDDASRDRTTELIRAFDDPRISLVVFPHNRGACIALNHSIERARGEHLCYLATDDYYLPGKLAKQVAYLDQHPEVLAVFGMPRHVDENGRTLPRGFTDFSIPYPTPSPTRAMWLRSFFFRGNSLAHPTAMVRRSAYERVGLFDPRLAGLPDFDMWVRICMVGEIFVMQEEIAAFRLLTNAGNMSAPRTDSVLRDSFEFFEILKHFRRMPPELALQAFGGDLHRNRISTDAGFHVWLADVAALGPRPAHALFALDTLFEMSSLTAYDHNRLIALVGQLDPFGLGARAALAAARRIPPPPGPEPMRPQKVGRNDFCPCGSGKKYKNCHGQELASFVDRQASDRL